MPPQGEAVAHCTAPHTLHFVVTRYTSHTELEGEGAVFLSALLFLLGTSGDERGRTGCRVGSGVYHRWACPEAPPGVCRGPKAARLSADSVVAFGSRCEQGAAGPRRRVSARRRCLRTVSVAPEPEGGASAARAEGRLRGTARATGHLEGRMRCTSVRGQVVGRTSRRAPLRLTTSLHSPTRLLSVPPCSSPSRQSLPTPCWCLAPVWGPFPPCSYGALGLLSLSHGTSGVTPVSSFPLHRVF